MAWVEDERLKVRCMGLILAQSTGAFVAGLVGGVILIAYFWNVANPWVFACWLLFYPLQIVYRLHLKYEFNKADVEQKKADNWFTRYGVSLSASGLTWGVFISVLSYYGSEVHAAALMVTYTALLAGAVSAYAVSYRLYLFFSLPLFIPVLIRLLSEFDRLIYLAALFVCWYLFIVVTAKRFSYTAMQSLGFEYENAGLVRELEEQNKRAAVLADELLILSNTDSLTGLNNRRYFDDKIKEEWQRARRNKQPLSLVLCDIDHFKEYNDSLGHPLGDECLKNVADELEATIREGVDFVCRYGGEEFAIVMTNTGVEDAIIFSKRLRRNVEALKIEHPNSPVSNFVTASFGVTAAFPSDMASIKSLIYASDQALYKAKMNGRNCIEISN